MRGSVGAGGVPRKLSRQPQNTWMLEGGRVQDRPRGVKLTFPPSLSPFVKHRTARDMHNPRQRGEAESFPRPAHMAAAQTWPHGRHASPAADRPRSPTRTQAPAAFDVTKPVGTAQPESWGTLSAPSSIHGRQVALMTRLDTRETGASRGPVVFRMTNRVTAHPGIAYIWWLFSACFVA